MPVEAIKTDTIMKTAEGARRIEEHDGSTTHVGKLKLNFGIKEDEPIPAAIPDTSDWNTPAPEQRHRQKAAVDETSSRQKCAVDETTARQGIENSAEPPSPQKSDNLPAAHEQTMEEDLYNIDMATGYPLIYQGGQRDVYKAKSDLTGMDQSSPSPVKNQRSSKANMAMQIEQMISREQSMFAPELAQSTQGSMQQLEKMN